MDFLNFLTQPASNEGGLRAQKLPAVIPTGGAA